ncbi:MAG: transcription elongation factor GreA [Oscillospiraceae bacterium]|jgi:transcription elongation factor GreA|nr:transcription elongation factor GreA [Oscillospiraceae bacterium]
MAKQTILTQEGLNKLEQELEQLKTVKRRDIAEKIKTALSFGDLAENSEYDEAKNEQGIVEARIAEIEATLMNVEILDADSLDTEKIQLGNKIKLKSVENKKEMNLRIVGSKEVDMKAGKISDESPIGRACIGHKVGDIITAEAPAGLVSYEILEISK